MKFKRKTNPLVASAPLPPDTEIEPPVGALVAAEIVRASVELAYALDRQRTAWAHMRQVKTELEERALITYLENELPWKLAVNDVKWWREEVLTRATTLNALIALRQTTPIGVRGVTQQGNSALRP